MTSALGGVEKGEAKHMLAATVTAMSIGTAFTPLSLAALKAMGAISTQMTLSFNI